MLSALSPKPSPGAGPAAASSPSPDAGRLTPDAVSSRQATTPKAAIFINFLLLLRQLGIKQVALPLDLDHAICTLSNTAGLLAAPLQVTIPFAGISGDPPQATAVFSDLAPGDGYILQVSLYNTQGFVVDVGQTGPLTLLSGSNPVSVVLTLTSGTEPLLNFFSGFFNSTSGSTVLVAGDTLMLYSGVSDARGVVARVELWLDGTAAAHYLDGTLLYTWVSPDFSTPYVWDTSGFFTVALRVQQVSSHTLTFNIFAPDNLVVPPNNLISSTTFPLTVEAPAVVDVGLQ